MGNVELIRNENNPNGSKVTLEDMCKSECGLCNDYPKETIPMKGTVDTDLLRSGTIW